MRRQTLVAEISKSYSADLDDDRPPLSQQFEEAIVAKRQLGYSLSTWQFSRVVTDGTTINETIIATFASMWRHDYVEPTTKETT